MYINYMEEDEDIFFKQIPIRCTLHLVSHGIYSIARGDEYGNEDWVILSLGINYSRWHWIRMSWAQKSINTSKKITNFLFISSLHLVWWWKPTAQDESACIVFAVEYFEVHDFRLGGFDSHHADEEDQKSIKIYVFPWHSNPWATFLCVVLWFAV